MRPSSVIVALALSLLPPSAQAQDTGASIADRLDGRLVQLRQGRLAATPPPARARYVAFYFGASWCGPCRAFVPELRDAYADLKADGVEIVFVSDDVGCTAMRDYVVRSRMPWPVVACDQRQSLTWLQAARGKALPGLIVHDARGRRVATSWTADGNSSPRRALDDLRGLAARP